MNLFCSLLDEFPVDHRNVKLKAIKERSVNIIINVTVPFRVSKHTSCNNSR